MFAFYFSLMTTHNNIDSSTRRRLPKSDYGITWNSCSATAGASTDVPHPEEVELHEVSCTSRAWDSISPPSMRTEPNAIARISSRLLARREEELQRHRSRILDDEPELRWLRAFGVRRLRDVRPHYKRSRTASCV